MQMWLIDYCKKYRFTICDIKLFSYLFKLFKVYRKNSFSGFQAILYIAFIIESSSAVGGIFGLKALTGDMPYVGFGNPWITYPRIAFGRGKFMF